MDALAKRIAVSTVAVACCLGLSVGADPQALTGEVCVERIVAHGSCDEAKDWEANLQLDLNRPYREMDIQLDTRFECRKVAVRPDRKAGLVVVQGFALEAGTFEVEGTSICVAKGESAEVAAHRYLSTGRVALVGDSALIFDSEVTSKVPGITVTSAPQLDFTCDLNEIEAAFLAKESGCESGCKRVRMLIVPTKLVLCHWAASGYEGFPGDEAWVNTSFVPMTRTQPESGLYRKFLAPHELGHVLLDGGDDELHSTDGSELMHHTGGRGVLPERARSRIIAESGPKAKPPLLEESAVFSLTGRTVSLRAVPPKPRKADGDQCSCSDTHLLRAKLRQPASSGNSKPLFTALFTFLKSEQTPVALYPALVSILEEEAAFADLTPQAIFEALPTSSGSEGVGVVSWIDRLQNIDPEVGKAAALLFEAAFGSVIGGDGLKEFCDALQALPSPGDDIPSIEIRESLQHVCAAEAAYQAWQTSFDGNQGGPDSLEFLERYIRQGFHLNTGEESLDLYGGGQPVVRWARRAFDASVTNRSQLDALWSRIFPEARKTPVYRAYLEQLAGL